MAPPQPPREPATVVIEEGRRLSESLLWALQRNFYARAGLLAWKPKAVPFYITSNAFTAKAYARTVVGFLRDLAAAGAPHLDRGAPVYIVELAAGSGQFACLFLRRLQELRAQVPSLRDLDLRYVMTDFAEANLDGWAAHERLRPFVEQGLLDFARFDLETDDALHLRQRGTLLSPSSPAVNPVVVLANYAFDSTIQDAFQARDGVLYERLVRVLSTRAEPDPTDPELVTRMAVRYTLAPVAEGRYAEDPLLGRLLERYRAGFARASFLVPLGAFRCLRRLRALSGDRVFLLTGDTAVSRADELAHERDPPLYVHAGGCFSFLVNLHALALYFEEAGGTAFLIDRHDQRFKVAALLSPLPGLELSETRLAFQAAQDDFGPADYYALVYGLREAHQTMPLQALLAQLRLGSWDYELVLSWRESLVKQAPDAPPWLKQALAEALLRVWDEFYPLQRDLAFELARIFLALKRPHEALRFGEESLRLFGPDFLTLMSIGYAHALLGQDAEALALIDRALALDPANAPARNLREQLARKLAGATPS